MGKQDTQLNSLQWSEYASRLLSPDSLGKLEELQGRENVGLLTFQVDNFYSLVGQYGEEIGFRLLESLRDEIKNHFHYFFDRCEILFIEEVKINDIVLCFHLPDKLVGHLANGALSFRICIRNGLNNRFLEITGQNLDVRVGHSWIGSGHGDGDHYAQTLFKAYCDARRVASNGTDLSRLKLHKEFVEIIEGSRITTVYQPIIDFVTGATMGWEALVRGPEGTHFHEPLMLLGYAEEIGKILALERKCQERAVSCLGAIEPEQRLFLNFHVQALNDPVFTPLSTLRLLKEVGLKPQRVVLEFSERHGIQDFSLLMESLQRYREQGYKVAIDDVGIGQSSLRAISQIRPDYIKIDLGLTRGIDFNPIKRVMVETFVTLSEKIGCKVIAEGIETATELSSLVSMGVHYGQGFFIAEPAYPKPSLCLLLPEKASLSMAGSGEWKCATPVKVLVQPALQVTPTTNVREVKQLLGDSPPMSSVVIAEGDRPMGLLMNYNLDRQLGTTFGVSLFYQREVLRLMDKSPLMVDISEAVEKVAKAAMNRDNTKIYDDIIVTERGRLAGTISVQRMLDTLAKLQVEMAKGANPLTGLPGNLAIEQEITRRANGKLPCSLIYIDLDNFKVYNDVYGFENGDRLILFTSKALAEGIRRSGSSQDFVGHVGGDDFVVISERERAESICKAVIELFDKMIPDFYSEQDQEKGTIVGKGRDGREAHFPFVSISIGIVECTFEVPFTMDELSLRVAEVKKYSKSIPGNAYVKDRRAPIGAQPQKPACVPAA